MLMMEEFMKKRLLILVQKTPFILSSEIMIIMPKM